MITANDFFSSHDADGFWTEVLVLLNAPDDEKLNLTKSFVARFPQQQSFGTLEQLCRFAVFQLFEASVPSVINQVGDEQMTFIIRNSAHLNAAAAEMWKWEQTGRTDDNLWDEAGKHIAHYCELNQLPKWTEGLLLDTMRLTVRIAYGFPPDDGVVRE